MEQFVPVPASLLTNSVTTQSVRMQELPEYKAEQPPTYQIDSLERDNNNKLFGKADTLMDKILSCSRIILSKMQTKLFDGVDSGVLLSDFTQILRPKNTDVPDIYFTLLDTAAISHSVVFNQNAEAKDRESWEEVMNVKSYKDCKQRVLLLTVLYATWQKLADYQYERRDSSYIERLPKQKFFW